MSIHPRHEHFPWQADYSAQPNLYSPYAVSIGQPEYTSKSLNIDSLGFRCQYDTAGQLIDLKYSHSKYNECTILLGNSSVFGVSLTEDCKTLGHFLSTEQRPCLNLGVRGATMQQELAIYLTHKHLLPPPKNIIILTGVCDISLATQSEDLWSRETGGLHSVDTFYKQHYTHIEMASEVSTVAKRAFLDWAEDRYHKYQWIQKIFERRIQNNLPVGQCTQSKFNKNLESIFSIIENVFQTWGWISKAANINITVVLQPVLGWTDKPLSLIEQKCVQADIQRIPAISLYANHCVHKKIDAFFQQQCVKNQLAYLNSNIFFNTINYSETHFSDICHLTDIGTKRLAEYVVNTIYN